MGPDINESLKGFAVNKKGEIRFGLGGLKGVGEAAIESIIHERKKNGAFKNIFDFIKRVNQRTVNKKSLESLAYAGAFDCFKDITVHNIFMYLPVIQQTALNASFDLEMFFKQTNSKAATVCLVIAVMPEIATPTLTCM